MDKLEMLMEADRRGLLPPDKQALLAEATKRGLVGSKVDQIPGQKAAPDQPPAPAPNLLEQLGGAGEAALSAGTGIVGGLVGNLAGVAKSITGGKYGTTQGAQEGQDTADSVMRAMTYQPRTQTGRDILGAVGNVLDATKLAGLNPAQGAELAAVTGPAITAGTNAVRKGAATVGDLLPTAEKPAMQGMGAATTEQEALRRARGQNLPVPIKLTKGEASRDFEQQRFEKETAKNAQAGEPLRQHAADNVQKVIQNFESWIDQTGAEAPDLISVGKAVDRPLVKRMESAKAEIRNAYDKAEKSGDMAEPLDARPLTKFLQENIAVEELPVMRAAQKEMLRVGGATKNSDGELIARQMTIAELENMRKKLVALAKTDDANGHFGSELKGVIDQMTDGKGGALYREAREMYKSYAAEFKNQGAVRDLVTLKKGTTDRKVALEDVFNHSVLKGSNQDTQNIIRSLEKAGPEGLQAIKELRGATVNWLLGETTKNATRDIRGQPIPSFSGIDKAVRSLDADGKLDLLFGKQQAAQIRDLKELIADLQTAPPGAVNTSTSAQVIMEAMGALATGRIPTAAAKAISGIKQAIGDRETLKRVRDALKDPDEDLSIGAGNHTLH